MAEGARWGTPVARRALAAATLGSGVAFLDGTIVNVALPTHRGRSRRRARRPPMDPRRLPGHAHRAAAARRVARRPLGPAAHLRRRPRPVHRRIGPLRAGAHHRDAGRGPGPAGRRRRPPRARQPRPPHRDDAPRRPGPRCGRVVGPHRRLERDRAVPRRVAHRRRVVAVGLPAQRAARRGRRVGRQGRARERRRRRAEAPRRARRDRRRRWAGAAGGRADRRGRRLDRHHRGPHPHRPRPCWRRSSSSSTAAPTRCSRCRCSPRPSSPGRTW